MAINPTAVTSAYTQALASKVGPGTPASGEADGTFGQFLSDAITDAVGTAKAGETAMAQGAVGQGDIVDVVTAVTAAEVTLETMIAVRDKVIAAYQEIMRMPI
jgi:flagellar hook-basal body complex protein FliE